MATMKECGIHVVESPASIGITMKNVLDSHKPAKKKK
jgi:hypothetical protein